MINNGNSYKINETLKLCDDSVTYDKKISGNLADYSDAIKSAVASEINGVSIVCSTVQAQIKGIVKALRHWPL